MLMRPKKYRALALTLAITSLLKPLTFAKHITIRFESNDRNFKGEW
jgi:hypothetical protein